MRFIRDTCWEDFPEPVRHQAKRCLLDTMGALLAGGNTPAAALVTEFVRENYRGDRATVLAGGMRTSLVGAALANGVAVNAFDIDDGYRLVKGHPGACVLPVVLGAGESTECTGKEFLTALVVGYEVGIRAGLIRHALYPTYHSSGSWGAVAGAAAAGKLFRFDDRTLWHVLGTAEYHAPIAPMMKGIATPSMGKDSIGWGCMVAMASALMGEKGFTGIRPLFDDTPDPSWIESLGQRYEILNLYFKAYAGCRWAQPAIAGALKVLKESEIPFEQIRRIEVKTFSEAAALDRTCPETTENAQYSLAYPLAVALIDGEVGPRQVSAPRIHDKRVHALMEKITVVQERKFQEAFPAQALADVHIQTESGERLNSGTVSAPWEPASGLPSDGELAGKFHRLAVPAVGTGRAAAVEKMIWAFDASGDAGSLVGLCTGSARQSGNSV